MSILYNTTKKYSVENTEIDFHCYGTRKECWSQISKGAKQSAFGKAASDATHVVLLPNMKKIVACKNLDFLSENITHLKLPLPLIKFLDAKKLPNLQNLTIYNRYDYLEAFELEGCTLDEDINVKSFVFVGDNNKNSSFWINTNINLQNYASLEHVMLLVDNESVSKEYLSTLTQVKSFLLGAVGTGHKDILNFVPNDNTEILSLACDETRVDFSYLERLNRVKYLEIRSAKSDFNCEYLTGFNDLKELLLFDNSAVKNVDVLLQLNSLSHLEIMYCGKLFKANQKQQFDEHGFEHLKIDYA